MAAKSAALRADFRQEGSSSGWKAGYWKPLKSSPTVARKVCSTNVYRSKTGTPAARRIAWLKGTRFSPQSGRCALLDRPFDGVLRRRASVDYSLRGVLSGPRLTGSYSALKEALEVLSAN